MFIINLVGDPFYIEAAYGDYTMSDYINIGRPDALGYDYILVQMEGEPGEEYGHAGVANFTPQDAEFARANRIQASMVGFSGFVQQRCDLSPCEQSAFYPDKPGCFSRGYSVEEKMLLHDCDGAPGSSGSSIWFPTMEGDKVCGLDSTSSDDATGRFVNAGPIGATFYTDAEFIVGYAG